MDTKRYDVGPDQGYRQKTTIKLTDDQARRMGLTSANVSKVTTTADDLAKRDRYDDAMTSQDGMRAAERRAAEEAAAAEEPADEAKSKKRGAPAAADA